MEKIYESIEQLIGNTPLLELKNIEEKLGLKARVIAKLESFNPAGSAKDRVSRYIIDDAETKGLLQPGATIIEPTSGNTGIGLALIALLRGYKLILTMPDTMSEERIRLIKAYGGQVVLTPGKDGMKGSIAEAERLAKEIPGSFIPGQFINKANPKAHIETTGPEIYRDLEGNVDIFVAGVGTGGTISGTGTYLKSVKPEIKVVAVEPADSPLLSKGTAGPHKIQGIGANFVPEVLDTEIYDEIITATTEQSYAAARLLAASEAVLSGISSGAALHAAIEVAKRAENSGKTIVVLLPDGGERYLSTDLFVY